MLIGLAMDYAVHLITRYEEELHHGKSNEAAITKAMVYTGQGIFTGALTTAGAFLAMCFTNFQGIREMGLICGGGLLVCFIPMMTVLPVLLLFGAALLALPGTSWCQAPSTWPVNSRVFRTVEGLPEPACISVTLAPQGRLFARHLKAASISEFDGYRISGIPAPETGKGRVYESPGGQLWTVVVEGLQEFRNGHWVLHPVPEIAAEFRTRLPRLIDPLPLCPVRQDVVLYLLPDRLLQLSAEDQDHPRTDVILAAAQTRLEKFSGMTPSRDGGLWIAGARGLAKIPNVSTGSGIASVCPPATVR